MKGVEVGDENRRLATLSLRLGLAFVFTYAAILGFSAPEGWASYFPGFIFEILPERIVVFGFAIFESILSIWFLFGWKNHWAALVGVVVLVATIIFNLDLMVIVFRNIGLVFAALALFFLSQKTRAEH